MAIRYFFKHIFILAFIIAFVSCQQPVDSGAGRGNGGNSGDDYEESVANWNGGARTFGDSRSHGQVAYEIPDNIKDVNIVVNPSSRKEINISYANINIGGMYVPSGQVQYITKTPNETRSASSSADGLPGGDNFWKPQLESGFYRQDHIGAQNFIPIAETSSRAAGGSAPPTPEHYTNSDVGNKTKMLYVDDASSYRQKQATLRAVGTHCYVWVVDGYFGTDSGASVSSTTAQNIASNFDLIYEPERAIFGEEFWEGSGLKVNIVIFDIYGDYRNGQNGGVLGYFHGKDYSSADAYTNYGKYFYIDSYFAHQDPNEIYSTLVHEFQHMINWNQKRVKHGQVSQTWYNEMLSLIAEDMMQSKLGLSNTLASRYKYFCAGYYISGITDWLYGDDVLYSYAMAAVFGAYLTRNHGGAQLVKNISQSELVNFSSVTTATGKSIEDLVKGFVEAVSLPNGGLNKAAPTTITYSGYNYPMGAIDLHNVSWSLSGQTYNGPALFKYYAQHNLRPYGFLLHAVGRTNTAGTVKLSFSSRPNSDTKLYVYAYEN